MLKHVAPSSPTASIPDLERGGFLPPEGRLVSWTPHWAGMAMRGEITVSDGEAVAEVAPALEAEPASEPAAADGQPAEAHPGA